MSQTEHTWTIYMYTFPNGKRYVGATRRPLHLRQGSIESGWSRYKNCKLLWEAIQEFGVGNIEQTVLFQGKLSDWEAVALERFFINFYKTNANRYKNPTCGYNSGDGGEGLVDRHLTEERKVQLAEQMRILACERKGKEVSVITRERQRMAKLGTIRGPMPEETKRKIGLGNSLENMSDEERQRRSDSKKQPVIAANPLTGEQMFFESGEEAADYFGVRPSAVSRWIDGSRNPSNGYRFYKVVEKARAV